MPESNVENPRYWDRRWETHRFGLQTDQALIFVAGQVLQGFTGKRTLEVASGRGIDSLRMAQKGAAAVVVDFSKSALEITRGLQEQSGVMIQEVQANAVILPFPDDSFDLVFSQGLMEHPGEREMFLQEQVRVTRPQGYVLIDMPNKYALQTPVRDIQVLMRRWHQGREYPMTFRQLERFMKKAGLTPVRAYGSSLIPLIHLGIKARLGGSKAQDIGNPPLPNFFTRIIEANIGHWFLNNVGVIGQKAE